MKGNRAYTQMYSNPACPSTRQAPKPIAGLRTAPDKVSSYPAQRDLDPTYEAAMMKHEIALSLDNMVFSSV